MTLSLRGHLAPACSALASLCLCVGGTARADVFINEFHYDNDGTDTGERVEVIAPAGTSLSAWKIVLYNGADGRQYATYGLSGTTANQCGGHGTVVVNVPGIQNGSPDGLALIDASGALVQLLSYEGGFTATDGPAAGRVATQIAVAETATTPVGHSLQLAGSGSRASDFTWQAPRASSFGTCNSGQTLVAAGGGGSGTALGNGVARTGLAAGAGSSLAFTLSVPAGASNLRFAMTGGSGDGDLYVRFGSAPTTTVYDCRPYLSGNAETCTFANPQAGTWHVSIRAYTRFADVSLRPSFDTASAPPSGYYSGVQTGSASALRASLHALIDDHTRIPYTAGTTDTWDVLNRAEQDPSNSGRILDVYKNASYAKVAGGNDFYNREHTWPNSLGFPNDGTNNSAYTDLHMLMASDIAYNAARGNKPYDNCPSGCTEYPTMAHAGQGGGSGVYPGNSNWSNASVFEVWSKLKGNVARAMFYMDVRYEGGSHGVTGAAEPDLRLTNDLSLVTSTSGNAAVGYMGRLSTLIQWHQQDPPDEAERLRNALIQTYQGNRNPFVDQPQWVACIYQSVCN